jgi:hypothetical protein
MNGMTLKTLVVVGTFWWVSSGASPSIAQDLNVQTIHEVVAATAKNFKDEIRALPAATLAETRNVDRMMPHVMKSLEFAEIAIAKGNLSLAVDSLSVARGMIDVAMKGLPASSSSDLGSLAGSSSDRVGADRDLASLGLTAADIVNVQTVVDRMSKAGVKKIADVGSVMSRLDAAGFDVAQLETGLQEQGLSTEQVVSSINNDVNSLQSLSGLLAGLLSNPDMMNNLTSRSFGEALAQVGADLDAAVAAVAEAISAGFSVELDDAAQGYGFDSFADAVDAYNEAHGTNYTEDEARDELGM